MTTVSYHVLGILFYCIGLILIMPLSGGRHLLGEYILLPQAPFFLQHSFFFLHGTASLFRIAGVLLYLKWLHDEQKDQLLMLFKKFEVGILGFFILFLPMIFQSTVKAAVTTFSYSGTGLHSIQYVKAKSFCTTESNQNPNDTTCKITIKNYHHTSQRVTISIAWNNQQKNETVYLLKRQEKVIHSTFTSAKPSGTIDQNPHPSAPKVAILSTNEKSIER